MNGVQSLHSSGVYRDAQLSTLWPDQPLIAKSSQLLILRELLKTQPNYCQVQQTVAMSSTAYGVVC